MRQIVILDYVDGRTSVALTRFKMTIACFNHEKLLVLVYGKVKEKLS